MSNRCGCRYARTEGQNFQYTLTMEVNIVELATQCPDVTISVKASDLLNFGRALQVELLDYIQKTLPETTRQPSDLLTREETMARLDVSSTTLWRWKKCGYLVPVRVGSMDRYRLSDINDILEAKGGAL